ncbi:hypothetical protein ACXM1Q_008515, partial [Streptococcus sp. 10F2]
RYPFLSPLPHDSQAWESLLGSPVAGAHRGLTPQMYDMPVVLVKSLVLCQIELDFRSPLNSQP